MYWWSNFDADEVREEFDVIASIGMRVVRLFLLWDDWMPTSDQVDAQRMRDFKVVCDIAAERGLQLDVTFFTGHMSGPNWSPRWLLSTDTPPVSPYFGYVRQVLSDGQIVPNGGYRNMFHDTEALNAERLLLKTVVGEFKNHPAIWMWNLGNEPDLFAHPHTAADGKAWVKEMRDLILTVDPSHKVTCGLHADSVMNDNGLRIHDVFGEADLAVMHGYPMYSHVARHNLDPDFVPFLCALTTALSGKPCLAEEWGGCTAPLGHDSEVWEWTSYQGTHRKQFMAGENAFADYVGEVLPKLVEVGSPGAMLWCYADYVESLWDRPPCDEHGAKHERHFGLVRPDGSLKPHAEVIRKFAATQPIAQTPSRTVTLDVTPEEYYANPSGSAERLYKAYIAQYETGNA